MKGFAKYKSSMKCLSLTLLSILITLSFTSVTYAKWSHGLGTGIFRLNIEGNIGVNTTLAGPVTIKDIDLEPDDVSDLMKTAFGFAGYSTDGTWMIKYALATKELQGDETHTIPANSVLAAGHTLNAELTFKSTDFEITLGYPVLKGSSINMSLDVGVHYRKHEIDSSLRISGPALNSTISRNIDESWADILFGTTITIPFTDKVIWNTSANAGLGESEATYMGLTGITWRFYKNWSSTLYGKYTVIEFERNNEDYSNWYLYDVDEFGTGLSFAYNW